MVHTWSEPFWLNRITMRFLIKKIGVCILILIYSYTVHSLFHLCDFFVKFRKRWCGGAAVAQGWSQHLIIGSAGSIPLVCML